MKKIEQLEVQVTYTVSLSDLKIDDDTYNELEELFDYNRSVSNSGKSAEKHSKATNWLLNHIKESDSMDWECEVTDLGINE